MKLSLKTFSMLGIILMISFDIKSFLGAFYPINIITSFFILVLITIVLIHYFFIFLEKKKISIKFKFFDLCLFVFFILYGYRLIYNIYIEKIHQTSFNNTITFIIFYLFLTILPVIFARIINFEKIKLNKTYNIIIIIYLIPLILNVFFIDTLNNNVGGRYRANELLDSIGYGHLSLTLVLLALVLFFNQKNSLFIKIFYLIIMIFGIVSMGIANSRSPFLALILIALIYLLYNIRFKILLVLTSISVLFYININKINDFFISNFNSTFIKRFLSMFDKTYESIGSRTDFYEYGLEIFKENPIFGKSILVLKGEYMGCYIHNFFIGSLMSVGIIGTLFYLAITFMALKSAIYLIKIKSKYIFFGLLFIQYFVYSMFSRTIENLPLYWFSCACVYSVYLIEKTNENSNIYGILQAFPYTEGI